MQYQYGGYSLQQQQMGAPNAKYKTMLCRHYEQTKQCSVGSKCQFAHGQNELRQMNDPLPPIILSGMTQPMSQQAPHNYKSNQTKFTTSGLLQKRQQLYVHSWNNEQQLKKAYIQDEQQATQDQQQYYSKPSDQYVQQTPQQQYQQAQQSPQPEPQYNLSFMRDQSVLVLLLQDMQQIFAKREDICISLKNAEQQAQIGKLEGGVNFIKQLMMGPDFTQNERDQYLLIYDRAKKYYEQITQQFHQQFNQYA